jgi:hypothetical protein
MSSAHDRRNQINGMADDVASDDDIDYEPPTEDDEDEGFDDFSEQVLPEEDENDTEDGETEAEQETGDQDEEGDDDDPIASLFGGEDIPGLTSF